MNLFYTAPENISGTRLVLTGQEALHAGKVLRYRTGDSIQVTDGRGGRFTGEIVGVERDRVSVKIVTKELVERALPKITVAFGLIKKRDRLEFAVEKSVELGAVSIILFTGDHSEKSKVNLSRLQATALSAMKQSLRCRLPEITHVHSLAELVEAQNRPGREAPGPGKQGGLKIGVISRDNRNAGVTGYRWIVADETVSGESAGLNEWVLTENILAIVGPEGGFSAKEKELLADAGSRFVSLGSHRLRTETAVINLLSRLTA